MNQPSDAEFTLASIRGQRRGRARLEPLSPGERDLYDWILTAFASGKPPEPDTLADAASRFEIDVEQALASLAREDLVHHDLDTGAILVAYPFSGTPRGHRVLIDGKHSVEAMCAIDALGIAPMLDLPIEITSRDPHSGTEIWVRLDPGEGAWWEPATAVVLDGCTSTAGPSYRSAAPAPRSTSSNRARALSPIWSPLQESADVRSRYPKRSSSAAASSATCSHAGRRNRVQADRAIADAVLTDLNGDPFELARFQGRRHVLFVWASW